MDLIQALKKADGKPVARNEWGKSSTKLSMGDGWLIWGESGTKYGMYRDDLFADDWYVVELLDDVIEREAEAAYHALCNDQPRQAHTKVIITKHIRRVLAWQAENGKSDSPKVGLLEESTKKSVIEQLVEGFLIDMEPDLNRNRRSENNVKRLVNVILDEAKKCCRADTPIIGQQISPYQGASMAMGESIKRIDALKIKL